VHHFCINDTKVPVAALTSDAPAHGAAARAAARLPGAAAPPKPCPGAAAAAAAAAAMTMMATVAAPPAGLPAGGHLESAGFRSQQCRQQTDAVPATAAVRQQAAERLGVAKHCHWQTEWQAAAGAGGSVGMQVAAAMTAHTGAAVAADCALLLAAAMVRCRGWCEGMKAGSTPANSRVIPLKT
jgi:hypothetical protein